MLKIAKTAAFVLAAMAPVLAAAQRAQGRVEHKPSPSSSATSAPVAQAGTQAAAGGQQLVTPENFLRANSRSNASSNNSQPAVFQPLARPATPVQSPQVVAPTSGAVPMPIAQPLINATPSPEATATVHYAQGQLTVVSQNASLGTVLKLIAAKTGALVDLAPELQNEPVIAQIGPGPIREVLTGLLDSPRIDYIIMGVGDAPGSLGRIVVRTRQSFARTAMAVGRPIQPRPEQAETEVNPDANGLLPSGFTPANAKLTQEQMMENWKKIREEKRLAEIEQQRQDRENEKTQVQVDPQPQPEPQTDNPPTDNPPLK